MNYADSSWKSDHILVKKYNQIVLKLAILYLVERFTDFVCDPILGLSFKSFVLNKTTFIIKLLLLK